MAVPLFAAHVPTWTYSQETRACGPIYIRRGLRVRYRIMEPPRLHKSEVKTTTLWLRFSASKKDRRRSETPSHPTC
eukprot:32827-Eustigmatos_ZCMA.PRE.1